MRCNYFLKCGSSFDVTFLAPVSAAVTESAPAEKKEEAKKKEESEESDDDMGFG
jgi:ribosomal protein L12E/L44/L45/RPP1/RPP2